MSVKSSSKLVRISIIIVLSAILVFLLFNDYGLIKYFQLKSQVGELEIKIEKAEIEIEKLAREIDSLKNNDGKIEKLAREKYNMHGKNEKAIEVEEE